MVNQCGLRSDGGKWNIEDAIYSRGTDTVFANDRDSKCIPAIPSTPWEYIERSKRLLETDLLSSSGE